MENKLIVRQIETKEIISKKGKRYTRRICIVECPRCQYSYKRAYGNLGNATKCRNCSQLENNTNKTGKGHSSIGEVSGTYINSLKQKARQRNIPWNLTTQDLYNLYIEQNRKCALSGLDIKLYTYTKKTSTGKSRHINTSIMTGSLDRMDSSKDYTLDNVQWVHKVINIMKNTLDVNDFTWFCKEVSKNNIEKENSEPSFINGNCSNAIMRKVQRLTIEDDHSNNIDTRIP